MKLRLIRKFPAYSTTFQLAFGCQALSIAMATTTHDVGFVCTYLLLSTLFWLVAYSIAMTREKPTLVQRCVIIAGPQIVLWALFLSGA